MKIAKHPSIWHRDYRWNISQGTSSTLQAETVVTRRKSKRSIQATVECDENGENIPGDGENDENLLNEYAQIEAAPEKRFKEDGEDSGDDEEMKKHDDEMSSQSRKEIPNRNPFKKTVESSSELSSPTEITKENNSLIKNRSPVKKIDYKRLEKLSRFNRTVVTANQDVLSKFFNNSAKVLKPQDEDGCDKGDESKTVTRTESIKETIQSEMAVRIHYTQSVDSAISDIATTKTDEDVEESNETISILQKFRYNYNRLIQDEEKADANVLMPDSQCSSNKTDSDISDVPIMISDESNDLESDSTVTSDTQSSSRSAWITSSQKVIENSHNIYQLHTTN